MQTTSWSLVCGRVLAEPARGPGAALVGDPDQIKAKLVAYQAAGVDAFILSGYPHRKECERFAALVLEDFPHAPLPR